MAAIVAALVGLGLLWGGWRAVGDILFTHARLCALERVAELRDAREAALAVAEAMPTKDAMRTARRFAAGISFQLDVQRAMCQSMHKPTPTDRLAWATTRELERELRRRAWRRWLHRRLGSSAKDMAMIRRSKP